MGEFRRTKSITVIIFHEIRLQRQFG